MTGKLSKNFHGVGIGPLSKILAVKWRNLSQTGKIGSGKNEKKKNLPTGLQVHLEDMF